MLFSGDMLSGIKENTWKLVYYGAFKSVLLLLLTKLYVPKPKVNKKTYLHNLHPQQFYTLSFANTKCLTSPLALSPWLSNHILTKRDVLT